MAEDTLTLTNASSMINITNTSDIATDEQETGWAAIFSEPTNVVIIIVSFIGLLANLLTVMATAHIPGNQTTHSKLIISLSIADMCITLSVFLHVLVKATFPLHMTESCTEVANEGFLNFALLATLINLLTMGIDHYVAIMKPLHYHLIMSHTRANIMVAAIWTISALGGFLDIIIGSFLDTDNTVNVCDKVYSDKFNAQIPTLSLVIGEMIILVYLYCHIFHKVKSSTYQFQNKAQCVRRRRSENNNMHSRKAVITTIIIVGTFMVCWIPNSIFHIGGLILLRVNPESVLSILNYIWFINNVLWILVLSNTLCDPLIYAVRLPVVQLGYKVMISKLFRTCKLVETRDSEFKRKFSHRESGRTYSSEVDVHIPGEEVQPLGIELSNAIQYPPREAGSKPDLNVSVDNRKHTNCVEDKSIRVTNEVSAQAAQFSKLLSNNNNDLDLCDYPT